MGESQIEFYDTISEIPLKGGNTMGCCGKPKKEEEKKPCCREEEKDKCSEEE
jgi:hypothetical protein